MPDQAFTAACGSVMPLGQHQGKTLARVGANADGLRYLDWLVGRAWVDGPLKAALETDLSHPAISRQLDAAIED